MITAIVVDDERLILSEIEAMVQKTGFIHVAKAYSSAFEALEEVESVRPQVAFVDIEMPELNGMALAEKMLEKDPSIQVVFITAYNQYAVKAFELNALDYILKPINPRRFTKTVKKIASSITVPEGGPEGTLEIQSFGSLEVKIAGKRVKWERSKAEELFGFLLMNIGQPVHKETIIEMLWPDYDPRKAIPILQTSVCKLRNIFAPLKEQVKLDYASSRYCLTFPGCTCELCFVEDVLKNAPIMDREVYPTVERAAKLISKGFLRGQGYLWAVEKDEQLRTRLQGLLKSRADYWLIRENWQGAVKPLKLLLEIVPYDEEANNQLLMCYAKIRDGAGIIDHFSWLAKVLRDDYDMEPALSTRQLYRRLFSEKYGA